MSKVSTFSTRARQRGSQCCAARLISGHGCPGNEGRAKAPHKRNKGKAGWRKKMESRNVEAPSSLQVVTSINEATLLATAKSGEAAAVDTLYRARAEKLFRTVHRITRNREGRCVFLDAILRELFFAPDAMAPCRSHDQAFRRSELDRLVWRNSSCPQVVF